LQERDLQWRSSNKRYGERQPSNGGFGFEVGTLLLAKGERNEKGMAGSIVLQAVAADMQLLLSLPLTPVT